MALDGGSSIKSLLHDLVESLQHKLDKLTLGERKLYDFVLVPRDRTFDFANRFPVLEDSGIYLLAPDLKVAKQEGEPEDWDKDGTLAGFSSGSEVAQLREFLRTAKDEKGAERQRRGKARKKDGKKDALPPSPPSSRKFDPVPLTEVESGGYLAKMLKARSLSDCFHRHAPGAGGRRYWQKCPVTTRMAEGNDVDVGTLLEPLARAMVLAEKNDRDGLKKLISEQDHEASTEEILKKAVKGGSDLRRYTVNIAPALARAMALMLEQGAGKKAARQLMVDAAPLIAAEFERVTGRRAVGVSIHFDSSLPHFNIWHSGLEPVTYMVGKSKRSRFRRTAMNLNSSGNMLAWDRVSRAFERAGEDFTAVSPATAKELLKAEQRALVRQGRPPGDFTLNRKADEVMETALVKIGYRELVERGYREFVDNERKRYDAGIAGRDSKDLSKIVDALSPATGESPLEAAQRIVHERQEITRTLASVLEDYRDLDPVIAIAELAAKVEDSKSHQAEILAALSADEGEDVVTAAHRVVGERNSFLERANRLFDLLARIVRALYNKDELLAVIREAADEFGVKLPTASKKSGRNQPESPS